MITGKLDQHTSTIGVSAVRLGESLNELQSICDGKYRFGKGVHVLLVIKVCVYYSGYVVHSVYVP